MHYVKFLFPLVLMLTSCSAGGTSSVMPHVGDMNEQWLAIKQTPNMLQAEILVTDPSDGDRPLWNYEALGEPPRTIKVGYSYPVKYKLGLKLDHGIKLSAAHLHIWQGGVDLGKAAPPPSIEVDLMKSNAHLQIDQPGYWTYSCQAIYVYRAESISVPCRWTNFFSR